MKQCRIACSLLLLASLYACGNNAPQQSSSGTTTDTVAQEPYLHYRRYTGMLAGKNIVAHLVDAGTSFSGYYYYGHIGEPISLYGQATDSGIVLQEEAAGTDAGLTPQWTLPAFTAATEGRWQNAEKNQTLPLKLESAYPEGSYRLDLLRFADSARLIDSRPQPQATMNMEIIIPYAAEKMPAAEAAFLNDKISERLGAPKGSSADGWKVAMQKTAAAYFKNYRDELGVIAGESAHDDLDGFAYQASSSMRQEIIMNEQGWLVLESIAYEYTGGAHGSYGSTFQNLDVRGTREWEAKDIFTDTTALLPLLDAAARSYFGIAAAAPLADRLLVAQVPFSNNFYIAPGGIVFVYNPYEIASYADGSVRLFLPYTRLRPFLQPAFLARMHLEVRQGMTARLMHRKQGHL